MILQAKLTGDFLTLFLTGIFGMLVLSVGLVVFFVIYQRRIFAQEQARQQLEADYQLQLLSAAVDVQESERRRIAGDLHDDIGSLLTATRLYLRQINPAATERTAMIKDQSLSIIDEMIQNTRRISHDLLPPALEKFGFQAAAEDLCDRIDRSGALTVDFSSGTTERPAAKREIGLFRVLQELMNNTIKHAEASRVTVSFDHQADGFHFTYADDGKGFDLSSTRNAGLGLRNVESRITIVGGTLDWFTAPGEGLRVAVHFPLPPARVRPNEQPQATAA